ncbi:MAG: hypothetical protein WAO35_28635 [Terriglobia bacterium]
MGGTFSGATIVPTGNPGNPIKLENDSFIPNLGALPATGAAMTSDTGLPPTNGVDVKLIHGRRHQQITGDMYEWVGGDFTSDVIGDETQTVTGNFTDTVTGVYSLTVTGGWQEEQQGPVNRFYSQKVTDNFDDDHDVNQPDTAAFQVSMYSNAFVYGTQIGICTGFFMALTTALSLTAANLDLEGKYFHAEHHPIHAAGTFVDLTADFTDAQVDALKALIAPTAKVEPAANAAPSVGVGTPFR